MVDRKIKENKACTVNSVSHTESQGYVCVGEKGQGEGHMMDVSSTAKIRYDATSESIRVT